MILHKGKPETKEADTKRSHLRRNRVLIGARVKRNAGCGKLMVRACERSAKDGVRVSSWDYFVNDWVEQL